MHCQLTKLEMKRDSGSLQFYRIKFSALYLMKIKHYYSVPSQYLFAYKSK